MYKGIEAIYESMRVKSSLTSIVCTFFHRYCSIQHRVIIAHEDIGIDIPVPIVTPGRMLEFPPTHTLLPNVTGEVKRFPEPKRNKIARKTIFYRQTFSL